MDGTKSEILLWETDGSKLLIFAGLVGDYEHTNKIKHHQHLWELLLSASSNKAEMLELCALHLLARALEEFYKIEGWKATT